MNPQVKELWTAALRSGRFNQGFYQLAADDSYCCLGVLCEIAVQEGVIDTATELNGEKRYGSQKTYLPQQVVDWADLESRSPQVEVSEGSRSLSSLNDSRFYDFNKIANLIERNL